MSNDQQHVAAPAVDSAKEIARRVIRRHNAREAAKLNAAALRIAELENSVAIAQTTLNEQSSELADAAVAVELLQARVTELEHERDAARADGDYYRRNFDQLLNALQAMRSNEFAHITAVLPRMRMQ